MKQVCSLFLEHSIAVFMNCSLLYHPFLHPFPPTQNSKIDACIELCLFHAVFSDHSSTFLRPVGFLDFFPLYLTGFGDFWWERKHTIKGQCGRTVVSWSKRSDFLQEMRTFEHALLLWSIEYPMAPSLHVALAQDSLGIFLHHWLWTDFRGSWGRTFSGHAHGLQSRTFSVTCGYQFSF